MRWAQSGPIPRPSHVASLTYCIQCHVYQSKNPKIQIPNPKIMVSYFSQVKYNAVPAGRGYSILHSVFSKPANYNSLQQHPLKRPNLPVNITQIQLNCCISNMATNLVQEGKKLFPKILNILFYIFSPENSCGEPSNKTFSSSQESPTCVIKCPEHKYHVEPRRTI
jgi:hypothetical protein